MNKLPIISADERLAEKRGIKGCIFGAYGVGKTSLLWTLPAENTLFIDLEAGDLAVQGWAGDTIRPRTWQECRDLAVFIGGANPSVRSGFPYSEAHYKDVCHRFGDPAILEQYETIFIDSITVAGRLCLQWCKAQPQCISEKTGKEDMRAAYGLHGQEMITWLTHLQHANSEFTILEGEFAKRRIWSLIGLYSEKNDNKWGAMGRSFIRSILNSAKGFSDKETTEEAQKSRTIKSFAELEGIPFIARIDIEENSGGNAKNIIKSAIDKSHPEYAKLMNTSNLPKSNWL